MSLLRAGSYVASVDRIDLDALVASGVRCILIDRDNTCVPRDAKTAPPEILAWLEKARSMGLSTCIVSNNFHSKQVERSAAELGCEVVHHAMKPFPFAVWRALEKMGASRDEAVLVGDQILTDVLAGSLSGVRSILVRPQSTTDLWYTHIFRLFERAVLKDVVFEGEGAAPASDAR